MTTNVTSTFLGIEMCLLLTSWGLISAPIFISLSLCLPCLFLLFYFGPALECCLFSTQTLTGWANQEEKNHQLHCRCVHPQRCWQGLRITIAMDELLMAATTAAKHHKIDKLHEVSINCSITDKDHVPEWHWETRSLQHIFLQGFTLEKFTGGWPKWMTSFDV